MNASAAPPPNGRRVSDSVVNKLAMLLMEAKRGNIEAVALVCVGPDGAPRVHFAGESDLAPSIYLGAGMMQHTLMSQIVGAPGATQLHSGIVLPGG